MRLRYWLKWTGIAILSYAVWAWLFLVIPHPDQFLSNFSGLYLVQWWYLPARIALWIPAPVLLAFAVIYGGRVRY